MKFSQGGYEYPGPDTPHEDLNARQILYEFWARWDLVNSELKELLGAG